MRGAVAVCAACGKSLRQQSQDTLCRKCRPAHRASRPNYRKQAEETSTRLASLRELWITSGDPP